MPEGNTSPSRGRARAPAPVSPPSSGRGNSSLASPVKTGSYREKRLQTQRAAIADAGGSSGDDSSASDSSDEDETKSERKRRDVGDSRQQQHHHQQHQQQHQYYYHHQFPTSQVKTSSPDHHGVSFAD